jgi:putative Holliday junction resolvase
MKGIDVQSRRIMGIDFGRQRIGIALSDPLGIIATPYQTLENDAALWERLKDIVAREGVTLCIVGMPLTLRGEKRQKANETDSFITRVKEETGLDALPWDERYTTTIAQKTLIDMNTKKKGRNAKNGTLDSMAAAIILQGYLDSKKNSLSC